MLAVFDAKGECEQIISLGVTKEMEAAYINDGKQIYRDDKVTEYNYFTDKWMNKGILMIRTKLIVQPFTLAVNEETAVTVSNHNNPITVQVYAHGTLVATDEFTGGEWSVEVDQPGKYTFVFTPQFPVMPLMMDVEAT